MKAVRDSAGTVIGMSDEAIFAMQRRLTVEEGIQVEPVSAASVAALERLVAEGQLQPQERVVCIFSGAGVKDTHLAEAEALALSRQTPLAFELSPLSQPL